MKKSFLVSCLFTSAFLCAGRASADETITAVMTVLPVDGERYAAVELSAPSGQALSALSWYNNDETAGFANVILMEATQGLLPDLQNAALVLDEVSGPTLAYGTLTLEQAVSSTTGRIWAVFEYPNASELSAKGLHGGTAVGIRERETPARTYLSHGGTEWIKLAEPHELAVSATLVAGKGDAVTLAELAKQRSGHGDEAAKQEPVVLATKLYKPFPNPFNPRTTVRFDLKETRAVRLTVYNLRGQRVRTLEHATLAAGHYERIWMGQDETGSAVASGLYFVRLEIGSEPQVQPVVLVR